MTYVNCNAILAFMEDGFCLSEGLGTSTANDQNQPQDEAPRILPLSAGFLMLDTVFR